ncbi:di-heme oxidoredictase family protein [Pseudomonas wadenswilerensis]|uniref:di-heme oxidoreductase family protein n=1 Tax=Pseudomonas wadenswilerensis TaxID=1785161 RepID=UPI00215DDD11|nr:di-heme oxidoredictase family protein [Pseudomonas wadenswilerensis]UVM24248.1 thiol oxidoreductase [Pseudomonas wadenswilerensis]
MKRYGLWLLLGMLVSLPASAEHAAVNREAFAQPLPGLDDDLQRERFFHGRSLFRQAWVVAPSRDEAVDGLGPLYNRISCIACHPKNGRGQAPASDHEPLRTLLVRLSRPGRDAHGGPLPHPAYGDQLNESAIPGVAGEGRAHVRWQEQFVTLADAERIDLRSPRLSFSELNYGPLDNVHTSMRVGSPVFGLGLLEAIEASTLQALADAPKPDGVKGRVNQVWSVERQRLEAGRFGLKSNQPDLRQQIASALHGDLGITSPLYPEQNCTSMQQDCRQAVSGGAPELDALQLGDLHFYLAHLAPPPRRGLDNPEVQRGERLFNEAGCAQCHRPRLTTGQHPLYPLLSARQIEPYSDLLLHDMGPGLADGRDDYLASGREWRTAPLWGLGLIERINPGAGYLHDGRARTLEEAVLWHGGEGAVARERFAGYSMQDRQMLLEFLRSL